MMNRFKTVIVAIATFGMIGCSKEDEGNSIIGNWVITESTADLKDTGVSSYVTMSDTIRYNNNGSVDDKFNSDIYRYTIKDNIIVHSKTDKPTDVMLLSVSPFVMNYVGSDVLYLKSLYNDKYELTLKLVRIKN